MDKLKTFLSALFAIPILILIVAAMFIFDDSHKDTPEW